MAERADVIFLVFLVGGAFVVVDQTGALGRATAALARIARGVASWSSRPCRSSSASAA